MAVVVITSRRMQIVTNYSCCDLEGEKGSGVGYIGGDDRRGGRGEGGGDENAIRGDRKDGRRGCSDNGGSGGLGEGSEDQSGVGMVDVGVVAVEERLKMFK